MAAPKDKTQRFTLTTTDGPLMSELAEEILRDAGRGNLAVAGRNENHAGRTARQYLTRHGWIDRAGEPTENGKALLDLGSWPPKRAELESAERRGFKPALSPRSSPAPSSSAAADSSKSSGGASG